MTTQPNTPSEAMPLWSNDRLAYAALQVHEQKITAMLALKLVRNDYETELTQAAARIAELERELSDVSVWGQACDDVASELKQQLAAIRRALASGGNVERLRLLAVQLQEAGGVGRGFTRDEQDELCALALEAALAAATEAAGEAGEWEIVPDGELTFLRGIGWLNDGVLEIYVDEGDDDYSVELGNDMRLFRRRQDTSAVGAQEVDDGNKTQPL